MKWLATITQLAFGAFEDGQSFLAGVLAKIPEADRAQAKALFEKAEAKDAVTLIGDSVLARSDYSKHMDALKIQDQELKDKLTAANDLYARNDDWWKKNEAALKEYPTLKAEIDRLKAGGGDDDPPKLDKKSIEETVRALLGETLDTTLAERERGYVDVVAFMQDTGFSHHAMFGTPVNMRELTSNAKLGKPILGQPGRVFGLQDAYNEKYGTQVAEKQKAAHDKSIEDEVQKRLTEERKKAIGHPFPMRGDTGPSVLDVLDTKEGAAAHTLDTAIAAYDALQAGRGL